MKKLIFFVLLFFITINCVVAKEVEVTFSACVDGDTAKFIYKGEVVTARFLAVDTPETVHPTSGEQPFGKEASNYTCNKIKTAKKIILEFDDNSDEKDKYDRYLVWVFVDGELLQKGLIEKGYAKVAYLYGDYKYTNILQRSEKIAKESEIGVWGDQSKASINKKDNKLVLNIIIAGVTIILIFIFSKKGRKKITSKVKRNVKNNTKKELKKLIK
jgi:Micrococcal nuclease (thermonuclease) homologs